MLKREQGFSLVEIVIVIAIIATVTAIIGPKALEAQGKSKSNELKDEFNTVVSAFTTLDMGGGSAVHAVKLDAQDINGNVFCKDSIVTVAPSSAFGTVIESEPFRRTPWDGRPLELLYGLNMVQVSSSVDEYYEGSFRHTGALTEKPIQFDNKYSTALNPDKAVRASSLSSQGAVGIAPIFSLGETKLLEDFVLSSTGLDWSEFESNLGSYDNVLAVILGGPTTNTSVIHYPYEPESYRPTLLDGTEGVTIKSPLELTIVDIDSIEASTPGNSLKLVTDASRGALYRVTGLMSRTDFVEYVTVGLGRELIVKQSDGTLKSSITGEMANKMYDKLESGFNVGTPVFVPHREKDIVKSTGSDLKGGYYRP